MRTATSWRASPRTLWATAGLLAGLLLLLPTVALGQYTVQSQVIAGGGAQTTGGGYVIHQTTAQSGPIGISTGGSYIAHHGFWHTVGGGGATLDPMVLSIALLNPTTARLTWGTVTAATFYDLYRSTSAHFSPSGSPWQTVSAPTTQYSFTDGIGSASVNYFFRGIARNASTTSPASNTVGEFDFGTGSTATGLGSPPGGESQR